MTLNQVEPDKPRQAASSGGRGARRTVSGNEGTGGQSFFDYDWKVGQTYRFFVTARTEGERTEFAGYFHVPEQKAWKHLVTFSTIGQERGAPRLLLVH